MRVIAIDGPAGAGKSTVAREVARRLGFRYLDTGALYRAVVATALERAIDVHDPTQLARLARSVRMDVSGSSVYVDGRDVTDRLRDPRVTDLVSAASAEPRLREALLAVQRSVASQGDVVIEGRDIGTVVAPDAQLKVFLTASLDERARRRARQLELGDDAATLARIQDSIDKRDRADSTRDASPLRAAEGGVVIDSTDKAFDEVVGEIVELARRHLA